MKDFLFDQHDHEKRWRRRSFLLWTCSCSFFTQRSSREKEKRKRSDIIEWKVMMNPPIERKRKEGHEDDQNRTKNAWCHHLNAFMVNTRKLYKQGMKWEQRDWQSFFTFVFSLFIPQTKRRRAGWPLLSMTIPSSLLSPSSWWSSIVCVSVND